MKCRRPNCPNNAYPGERQGYCNKHYGLLPPSQRGYVDAGPVRERIALLRARGYGIHELAEQAGMTRAGICYITDNLPRHVTARVNHAIMNIPVPARVSDHGGIVDAIGTRRRVQALAVIGWPQSHVAEAAGMDPKRVSRSMRQPTVYAATAATIAEVFDRLQMQPGPCNRTRIIAAKRGWVPPLAWDEHSIDDPAAAPVSGPGRQVRGHAGLPHRTKETPKASRPPKPVNPPRACLVCGDMFKSPAPNAQVCSDKCRQVRTRIREASYAGTSGTRLCPKCYRALKPRFTTIPRHFDGTGQTLCPTAGEPYSITLPNTTGGMAS